MKNVIVFAIGGAHYAVELRWVREVITLGFVTPVPGAPGAIIGVVNCHGQVTPVVSLPIALGKPEVERSGEGEAPAKSPRKGAGAVVIEVEGATIAIHMSNVEEVSTLTEGDRPAVLTDSFGREVPLIDCPELLRQVLEEVNSTREPEAPAEGKEQNV